MAPQAQTPFPGRASVTAVDTHVKLAQRRGPQSKVSFSVLCMGCGQILLGGEVGLLSTVPPLAPVVTALSQHIPLLAPGPS